MESIIKHLMEITGHRDHDLLNISVISALNELTNAERCRVLGILQVGDKVFIKPQITIEQGEIVSVDDTSANPEIPLSQYPDLAEAITRHENVVEYVNLDGDRIVWLPVWMNEKISICLEIFNPNSYTDNTKEVMSGIMVVYRNFQNLLDYSERDSLTGLLNRKTFDDNFSKILRTSIPKPYAETVNPPEIERRHSGKEKRIGWRYLISIILSVWTTNLAIYTVMKFWSWSPT